MLLVQSVFQDGLNTFVEEAVDGEGIGAGGFETFFGVLFSQADDAQAGAETLLGMGFAFQDVGDQFFGVGSGLGRPADDSGGGPFQVLLMGFGHMFWEGGIAALAVTAGVAGDPSVFE